ncbi:hypothetical protein HYC85_001642, partial [Camellia sinensis]
SFFIGQLILHWFHQLPLQRSLKQLGNKIRLWNKGVDSESFHLKYRSQEMRIRLSNGEPERPLIVHVGRLGVEKSLDLLKREDLEKLFSGMPAVFTGMLGGEELSQAHASRDVFVMPSESETPGHNVIFRKQKHPNLLSHIKILHQKSYFF